MTGPFVVLVVHAVVLWAWHVPAAFEFALRHELVHAIQHLMFFVTAALFWWALIHGRYGRVGYGLAVFFVFAMAMHTSILGALFTFARRLWYPSYTSLEDQQLAGLIMWIPSGVTFLLAALALFAAWLGESERRARASTTIAMLALLIVLGGCAKPETPQPQPQPFAGDVQRGKELLAQHGCNVCHVIRGIGGPQGSLGPDLTGVTARPTISEGKVQNTPANLVQFIQNPPSLNPSSRMPPIGITPDDAKDMAAYLHTQQ